MWFTQSVVKLGRFGYSLAEVGEMPLPRFKACLDAADQIIATERMALVADMASVAAAIYAKKGKNPLKEHLDLLGAAARGDLDDGNS